MLKYQKHDLTAISAIEARQLFSDFKNLPTIIMAVSGGPDSLAMMMLAARWRASMPRGPKLIAVTIDHELRREGATEARAVKKLAKTLGVEHHTLRWTGSKPKSGVPAAARDARYQLLAHMAHKQATIHILTAHTRDDQAETVLMRLARGSGLAGLSAMARQSERDGVILARPFLDVPKSRMVATLEKAGIAFAMDPTNHDLAFTRPRLRALMPALAKEGCDARNLARLASRLARANTALEAVTEAAEHGCAHIDRKTRGTQLDAPIFFMAPEEIRLRVLIRAIERAGCEGPVELGKAESLLQILSQAHSAKKPGRLRRTLAGAMVSFTQNAILVAPAPPRRVQQYSNVSK